MGWRPREQPREVDPDKPDLRAVLEHYGAHVTDRNTQMVRCVLHEDHTPSMSLRLDEGVWKCHSCGEGGDVWTLLMKKEGVDFGRARSLAATLGFTTGGAGDGGSEVRGSSYAGRRGVAPGKGDHPKRGGYVPAWRRR